MTSGKCHAGGYLCSSGHELRVTVRCLTEDLGRRLGNDFADLLEIPIVRALVAKRGRTTMGGKTVGPSAGERTFYHLGQGDDHRGATWFDVRHDVVWLCAYGRHRSGSPDDAFPYFRALIAAGRIMPIRADYEWLRDDRSSRAVTNAVRDGKILLSAARAKLGSEVRGTVALQDVGVVVEVVESVTETYVAIKMRHITPEGLQLVLLGFYPERDFGEWQPGRPFPARPIDVEDAEMCFSILHDSLADD